MTFEKGTGLLNDIVKEDNTDYGEFRANLISDEKESYTIDTLLIKGLSPIRSENDCNFDYEILKEHDSRGMRFYLHKYFSGYMHYYLHLKYE